MANLLEQLKALLADRYGIERSAIVLIVSAGLFVWRANKALVRFGWF